ncbi:MAG: hypothetical protein NTU66_06820 [Elusimicrobia bacterium]|nr:hypothetical protein [Elusimicrobiota bacterium]
MKSLMQLISSCLITLSIVTASLCVPGGIAWAQSPYRLLTAEQSAQLMCDMVGSVDAVNTGSITAPADRQSGTGYTGDERVCAPLFFRSVLVMRVQSIPEVGNTVPPIDQQRKLFCCRGAPPGATGGLEMIKTGHISLARGDTAVVSCVKKVLVTGLQAKAGFSFGRKT